MTCPQCGHDSGRRTRYCPCCAKRLGPTQTPGGPLRCSPEPLFVLEPVRDHGGALLEAAPYLVFLVSWATFVAGGLSFLVARSLGANPHPPTWFASAALLFLLLIPAGWRFLEGRRLASMSYTFRPHRLDVTWGVLHDAPREGVQLEEITAVRVETTGEQRRHGLGTLRLELREPHLGRSPLLSIEDIAEPELWRERIVSLLDRVVDEDGRDRQVA
ncbi:MAG TPA: PH domain-containing protein [Planctomycetes bacterium]|nr:PH domain-containing protein [Planctomycetota bacterium]